MKRPRIIAGIAIALLMVASLVAAFLQASPLEVARRHCAERGFQVDLQQYQSSGGLFGIGNGATVKFQVKGANPPKKVVVELRQAVYFLPWQVVKFREESQQ